MNERQSEEILRILGNMNEAFRSEVTEEERAALDAEHAEEPEMAHYPAGSREEAMLEFTVEAMQMIADDMEAVLEQRMDRLYRQALEVYNKAEELSRDPNHAHLIVHVEAMRRAHEQEYGYPPPPASATNASDS